MSDNLPGDMKKRVYLNKLVCLGDVFVGKTSISSRFAKDEFSDVQESTVGNKLMKQFLGAIFLPHSIELADSIIKFEIWDTAGQERFRSLAPMYYKNAKAAVVVYDITSYETFKRAQKWIEELNQNASPDTIIALVGNKIDLEQNRQVQTHDAKEFADSNGLFHFEVSAKNNINIKEVFLAIAKKLPLNDKLNDTTGVKLDDKKDNVKKKFCYCV